MSHSSSWCYLGPVPGICSSAVNLQLLWFIHRIKGPFSSALPSVILVIPQHTPLCFLWSTSLGSSGQKDKCFSESLLPHSSVPVLGAAPGEKRKTDHQGFPLLFLRLFSLCCCPEVKGSYLRSGTAALQPYRLGLPARQGPKT